MESAADFKSCKAHGVIARCPLTVQQGFPVASYKAFRGPPASCKLLKFQLTAHNPKVGGSNPPPATNLNLHKDNHLDWISSGPRSIRLLPVRSPLLESYAAGAISLNRTPTTTLFAMRFCSETAWV